MKEIIMKVPSFSADYPKAPIFVADLVRCGECIYWKNSLCQAWHRVIPKDGYCSIGERDVSTQTETQNSNLTFEKDECAKEYEELGLKELKELIEADRKTENCSEKPNNCEPKICDFCRYYNSNIPCGSTPSACKEADKFAEEFVDGLKKLKPKDEPQTESLEQFRVGLEYHTDTTHFGKTKGESVTTNKIEDEPQTEEHCETCRHKDECEGATYEYKNTEWWCLAYAPIEDEPQTERSE